MCGILSWALVALWASGPFGVGIARLVRALRKKSVLSLEEAVQQVLEA